MITVTATDSSGLAATDTVVIGVARIVDADDTPRGMLEDVADDLLADGSETALAAEAVLRPVLTDAYWTSDSALSPDIGEDVFKAIRDAATVLERDAATADECCEFLVEAARILMVEAVEAVGDLRPQDADKVRRKADAAEAYAEDSSPSLAVDEFRKAWKVAQ